jgi:hypothetical protein
VLKFLVQHHLALLAALVEGVAHDVREQQHALGRGLGERVDLGVEEVESVEEKVRIDLTLQKGNVRLQQTPLLNPQLLLGPKHVSDGAIHQTVGIEVDAAVNADGKKNAQVNICLR